MSNGFSDGFLNAKKDGKDSLSFSDKAKLIASNLKTGVSIKLDGQTIAGTVIEYSASIHKKFATGLISSAAGFVGTKTVNGLSFNPSLVIWFIEGAPAGSNAVYGIMISTQTMGFYSSSNGFTGKVLYAQSNSGVNLSGGFDQNAGGNWQLLANGFQIYVQTGASANNTRWFAFE